MVSRKFSSRNFSQTQQQTEACHCPAVEPIALLAVAVPKLHACILEACAIASGCQRVGKWLALVDLLTCAQQAQEGEKIKHATCIHM
jgi:hypothetical protein